MRIIAGTAGGARIDAPAGRDTRPTLDRVRENLFNMLQGDVPGSRVLDLFAGSGALSLEALSRGADFAVLVDHDRQAVQVEKRNIQRLRMEDRTRVLQMDWRAAAKQLAGETFDLVFLDPPYQMTDLREVFLALEPLLAEDGRIILEHEAKADITVCDSFEEVRRRSWGYCGVTFYARRG